MTLNVCVGLDVRKKCVTYSSVICFVGKLQSSTRQPSTSVSIQQLVLLYNDIVMCSNHVCLCGELASVESCRLDIGYDLDLRTEVFVPEQFVIRITRSHLTLLQIHKVQLFAIPTCGTSIIKIVTVLYRLSSCAKSPRYRYSYNGYGFGVRC
jgi:hypothetical protein